TCVLEIDAFSDFRPMHLEQCHAEHRQFPVSSVRTDDLRRHKPQKAGERSAVPGLRYAVQGNHSGVGPELRWTTRTSRRRAILHDQARGRRRAGLRGDQAAEILGLMSFRSASPLLETSLAPALAGWGCRSSACGT